MASREGFAADLISGVLWGWLSMLVNSLTGIFVFEAGFVHDLVSFALAGVINGLVVGLLLTLIAARLPLKSFTVKAVIISVSIWLVLRAGAVILSNMHPDRYHVAMWESLQGLLLAVLLGVFIGLGRRLSSGRAVMLQRER